MADAEDFDAIIDPYHQALGAIINSDPGGYKALYSEGEDISLANPMAFAVARGRSEVFEKLDRAASKFGGGEVVGFESIARCVTPELGYIVEVERFKAKVDGAADPVPIAIRVTSLFRPEHGTWKLVHRHADPPVSTWFARPPAG
jgi:ketosteroid isomerase-like protein